jgi:RimJ/RimL family protein N-acetyltransferase
MSTPGNSLEGMLTDGRVIVRPLRDGDARDMAAAVGDGEYAVWEPAPGPYTAERALGVVREYEQGLLRMEKAAFAILDAATGEFVGSAVLLAGPPPMATGDDPLPVWLAVPDAVEIAYWVRQEARGRGFASRAVRLLALWALDQLGLRCVWLEADPDNIASLRVAEKAGFVREVVLPDHCRDAASGEPHDCVIFARLLGEQWPAADVEQGGSI